MILPTRGGDDPRKFDMVRREKGGGYRSGALARPAGGGHNRK